MVVLREVGVPVLQFVLTISMAVRRGAELVKQDNLSVEG